ncbi:MAG: TIGR00730 family Rossman fold protein [Deltaproteobacteria bacterium]|nr:TIGR00730 family Rossman fold protein [Deltaproteobacteria bacterium]
MRCKAALGIQPEAAGKEKNAAAFEEKKMRICVYCGSRFGARPEYQAAAKELGEKLAARNISLVYGGGSVGLMGVTANAVMEAGGEVIGVIPEGLFDDEVAHTGLSELITTDGMHPRKLKMTELADAFLVLPGGVGTLDETFEAITWRQIGVHDKPIGFLDVDNFFSPFFALMKHMVEEGFIDAVTSTENSRSSSVDEILDQLVQMHAATAGS